ncbi:MAG: DUF2247 family protein [Candidatus Babeliales bacterium]
MLRLLNNPLIIFKKYGIEYTWMTLYVGRMLGLVTNHDVEQYATEYLIQNPELTDMYVAELAARTYADDYVVDDKLITVLRHFGCLIIKDSPQWNIEKRKWRYCILQNIAEVYVNECENLLQAFDDVYADFGYPEDMKPFSSFAEVPEDAKPVEDIKEYDKELCGNILHYIATEKGEIEKKNFLWPVSLIYYPIDNNDGV